MSELIVKTAVEIVGLLRAGEITISDTLEALETRIEQVDSSINALPTLCLDRAREAAKSCEQKESILSGLPVAIKDLTDVAGVRTTYGSMVSQHHVPAQSDFLVENLQANGAIVYAKSNTPEFGSGGNTFNDVFGATRNPYDSSRTVGGSSGGAAAALASGSAWLAQGSDLGGSLRTPASFCGVTSLRPSAGLMAKTSGMQPFQVYSQAGPMARCVTDLALFADAMTGSSPLMGLSQKRGSSDFRSAAATLRKPARIAYSVDLGITETAAEVTDVCNAAIARIEIDSIPVELAHPDLSMADAAFDVPRALDYAQSYGAQLDSIRDIIKPENVWNIEYGMNLDADEIRASMDAQGQIFHHATGFMQDYDLLICPAAIIAPFPVEERYPGFSQGLEVSAYYRWLAIAYAITTTTLPVITLPCGKTREGLPVGIQLVGKAHGEQQLFSFASYIEQLIVWDPLQRIS